ncbi:protein phosphatase 2C domain-containing protein [Cognatiyoonia sp. IB215446]|uniref:PP2C family protein-serine/threonine phosphatase n=1 Tax=Cognatiyoonia sp. IB215446 TaxID=3097355 RepID=UPI002A0B7EA2|nr:protein phosphatase 2C domain-containing protein [Cognatiyoonia sp. IB215446]MDX8346868.1 protein phosphatase 2C domain-containing protein [Cognatiyoonia sp. IB215446]
MTISSTKRHYSAKTHIGRVRKVNEDAILALPHLGLWLVSDGMGGHAGGDFASQTIVDILTALPADLSPADVMHAARTALGEAHRAIQKEATRRGSVTIGATVVLLALSEEHFMCLWAGDSRLYRLRDERITMISSDHSIVGELVEAGQLTWAEAENHPHGNQITRAVGVDETLLLDKRRGDILPGDRFLLCSDGLTKYADAETLQRHLCDEPIDRIADDLIRIALDGGGADNVSVIVVDI